MKRRELRAFREKKLNVEKLVFVLLFGFSPRDTEDDKKSRGQKLEETCRLLQMVGEKRIISVPENDRKVLDRMGLRLYGFAVEDRPCTSALSDARTYVEKSYLKEGWLLGISDADLKHFRIIGSTDISPRIVVNTPEAFARAFNNVPFIAAKNPTATVLVWQARNNPSDMEGVDTPEPIFKLSGLRAIHL